MAEPVVSVIMAVYNAGTYLDAALDSTLEQGLDESQIEVIAVDDGSTDGSAEVLDRFAAAHPCLRVIHQENSGGPGAPRNTGLDLATGRYVFFLDADDMLAEHALRDLAAVADREGSDVVLGQVRGIDGRSARGATFAETRLRVDLLQDRIFRTLGPWKLFRRHLLESHSMRFRTDVKVAEDQLLVAHAYLRAANISICADRDYYLLRRREDGGNVTRTTRGPTELVDAFTRLTDVIVGNTEQGELRDAVLWRAVTWSLGKPLDARFLRGSAEDQQYVVDRIRAVLGPVHTPGTAAHQGPLLRTKTELALARETATLRRLIRWEKSRKRPLRQIRLDTDGAAFDLPDDLAEAIGPRMLQPPHVSGRVKLVNWQVQDTTVHLHAAARIRGAAHPAPEVLLRWKERTSGETIDLVPVHIEPAEYEVGMGVSIEAILETEHVADGVWDVWLVQRAGDLEIVRRFGGLRSPGVTAERAELRRSRTVRGKARRPRGLVYFTKKAENLSLDLGYQLHEREEPRRARRQRPRTTAGATSTRRRRPAERIRHLARWARTRR